MIKLKDFKEAFQTVLYLVDGKYRTASFRIKDGNVFKNENKSGWIKIDIPIEIETIILFPDKEILRVTGFEKNRILVTRDTPTLKLRNNLFGYCVGYKDELTYTSTFPKNFKP